MAASERAAIIGGGPAGIAAAIQLTRHGITPVLFEMEEIGGLLRNANMVKNYPGFPAGIRGADLVSLFKEQLKVSRTRVVKDRVTGLQVLKGAFLVQCEGRAVSSDAVVIASGTVPRKISGMKVCGDVESRILYEVWPLRDIGRKRIAIIGSGDAAFDYADGLLDRNKVTILSRSRRMKCLPTLRSRIDRSANAALIEGANILSVTGQDQRLLLRYESNGGNKSGVLESDYLLIAVGRDPCLDFLGSGSAERLESLRRDGRIHLAGDVKNGACRQVGISVGDGLKAAMRVSQELLGEGL